MRRFLDGLYRFSGALAAFFLLAIGVSILAQIVGRFFGKIVDSTELAGFCLAASSFLGLGYTLRGGGHIRVNMLVIRFTGKSRRAFELWCCAAAASVTGFLSVSAALFVWQTYTFGDISPGLLAAPFWIPQTGMVLGLIIMTVALVDDLLCVARGQTPSYEANSRGALE